jgi:hypothetical protein
MHCDQNGPSARRSEPDWRWERSISEWIRDRRATQPPAHFHRNPPGRGQLAVFLRCSLDPYDSDMGARSRLEKQPTDSRQNACYFGDRTLVLKAEKAASTGGLLPESEAENLKSRSSPLGEYRWASLFCSRPVEAWPVQCFAIAGFAPVSPRIFYPLPQEFLVCRRPSRIVEK